MQWRCGAECSWFSWHGTAAVLFFLSIAYVCLFRASDTLSLIPGGVEARPRYERMYRILGAAMIVLPLLAVVLSGAGRSSPSEGSTVFLVEAVTVIVFALYWIVKSHEMALSKSERSAAEGRLKTPQMRARDAFRQISLERVNAEE
jgi:small-conductance mechanosensitive channel